MAKYHRKSFDVDAVQWDGKLTTLAALGHHEYVVSQDLTSPNLIIETAEGDIVVKPGDWVIKDNFGQLLPCPAGLFATRYEPV